MPSDSNPGTTSTIGTISMYDDQTATLLVGINVPPGAEPGTPPAPTFTEDAAGLLTVTGGPVTVGGGGFAFQAPVTVVGNGTPGNTTLRCSAYGQDLSDVTVILNARPEDSYSFELSSVVISDPPAAQ